MDPRVLREKKFSDIFSNFEQDFDELKGPVCLQQNCKHVFDELKGSAYLPQNDTADASIENVIKNENDSKRYCST